MVSLFRIRKVIVWMPGHEVMHGVGFMRASGRGSWCVKGLHTQLLNNDADGRSTVCHGPRCAQNRTDRGGAVARPA